MRRDLGLVEPLRWRDVKDRECGCEQFRAKHARDIDRFDGSHNVAKRESDLLPPPYIPVLELSIFLWNLIIIGASARAAGAVGVMIVKLRRKQLGERRGGDELG